MHDSKKLIRSRRISILLPWLGIIGMLILTFSLIMYGFLLFFTELGFIANFYYFIDAYNWIADRLTFDRKRLLTDVHAPVIHLVMILSIVLAIISTGVLAYLREQNFLQFCIGISFISAIYFGSRLSENALVILHIAFDSWKNFYLIVGAITALITGFSGLFLYLKPIFFFIFLGIICIGYVITYHTLIEIYGRTESGLGGHKYFIDLPDNRFAAKYR